MRPTTVIVDYGTGNLNSIRRTLDRVGATAVASCDAVEISHAEKIILPGVGHFGNAMLRLVELGLLDALNDVVLSKGRPVLGICLGMELMAKSSEEGNAIGLGWIDARAVKIKVPDDSRYKVPHMGWNQVLGKKASALTAGIDESSEFYFAHSYYLELNEASDLLTETTYAGEFPSAIEKDNIFGVQFHPEKSHDAGARLLKNFVDM
jgi:imidazole glycerol-phosphate synthase subunit HisH